MVYVAFNQPRDCPLNAEALTWLYRSFVQASWAHLQISNDIPKPKFFTRGPDNSWMPPRLPLNEADIFKPPFEDASPSADEEDESSEGGKPAAKRPKVYTVYGPPSP